RSLCGKGNLTRRCQKRNWTQSARNILMRWLTNENRKPATTVRVEFGESRMSSEEAVQHVDTIVIGRSQAGLAIGYHLAKRAVPFLILDANQRIDAAWRNRWDSLLLFTPARYNALPGRFPARGDSFPRKDEIADYLESYAKHFRLPVRTGVRVD